MRRLKAFWKAKQNVLARGKQGTNVLNINIVFKRNFHGTIVG